MYWSKAFHGVQHLQGIPNSHQITLEDYDKFTRVYVLALHSNHPFEAVREENFPTVAEAMIWGEAQAKLLFGADRIPKQRRRMAS